MRIVQIGALLLLIFFLNSCATMSRDECIAADWRTIGFEDGSEGMLAGRIRQHREVCAKHGVIPDLGDYTDGRAEGLVVYCRPSNGFLQGRNGHKYLAVCPGVLEEEFLVAYGAGRAIGESERYLHQLNSDLDRAENRYQRIAVELDDSGLRAKIISDESTPQERAEMLQRIELLEEERRLLDEDIHHLQHDIGAQEAKIQVMLEDSRYY